MEIEERLRALLLQGLAGEARDYERFLAALSTHLRAFLRRRLGQWPDEVEDLVRYKLVDWFRAHAVRGARNVPLDGADELFSTQDQDAAQARRDLGLLLETLPDKQRLPIQHVKLEGLSVVETARLTGLSESAVKVGVHRGLKALAARIRGLA